jgi:large subunit ribosomal protein L30
MAEGDSPSLYAAVMLRGTVKITRKIVDTLEKLRLTDPNSCAVVPADATHAGMLKKVAEFVTWGEVSEETLEKLLEKRGRLDAKEAKSLSKKALKEGSFSKTGFRPVFRLAPPGGGLKSARLTYPMGDTGYRGKEINRLLERMI